MILLIGASSFIGVHTARLLLREKIPFVVTGRNNRFREYYESQGIEYINFEMGEKESLNSLPVSEIDAVFILAGLLPANVDADLVEVENAEDYFTVNTLGTAHILEYSRSKNISRVISTTTYSDLFKYWEKDVPLNDDHPRGYKLSGDHAVYAISKNAASDLMLYYNEQHGMKNCVFRLPPVYGVGPHGSIKVDGSPQKSGIQHFIDNALQSREIVVYGNGELSRDIVSVKDVASAFLSCYKSEQAHGLYNISSGKSVTLAKQARIISKLFSPANKTSEVIVNPNIRNLNKSYLLSIEKAKRDFGYAPKFSDFEEMMIDYKNDLDNQLFKELFNY